MHEGKQTFLELIIGIIFCSTLFSIPGFFWGGDRASYFLGLALGVAVAISMVVSMYRSIDRSLEMSEKDAVSYTKKKVLVRILIMVVAIFVVITNLETFHFLGALVGILSLKFSAYIQPLTHKFIFKFKEKRKVRE
ncbi:MAG: hypothetical protein E7256_06795 [Lachnospiraceae bacterium]|nr:hypothetical protein [Lachnospiraceae bacterium]